MGQRMVIVSVPDRSVAVLKENVADCPVEYGTVLETVNCTSDTCPLIAGIVEYPGKSLSVWTLKPMFGRQTTFDLPRERPTIFGMGPMNMRKSPTSSVGVGIDTVNTT